jgi:hypothetical protein
MARTHREIAIEGMLRAVEEAMCQGIDYWGDLPPPMKEAIEQFRIQLGAAIDSVEFVKRALAARKAHTIVDDLRAARMNTAADLIERSVSETLTYYAFPDIHWQKIRTNNPLERIMREIRRRTRVVGAFPDGQSCLNLAAARLRYVAGTAWSAKRYMNMRPLYLSQTMQTGAVA